MNSNDNILVVDAREVIDFVEQNYETPVFTYLKIDKSILKREIKKYLELNWKEACCFE